MLGGTLTGPVRDAFEVHEASRGIGIRVDRTLVHAPKIESSACRAPTGTGTGRMPYAIDAPANAFDASTHIVTRADQPLERARRGERTVADSARPSRASQGVGGSCLPRGASVPAGGGVELGSAPTNHSVT